MYCILALLFSIILRATCIEVHFEAGDSGFFLKHYRQPPVPPEISNTQHKNGSFTKENVPFDRVLSSDRFTVTETNQPVSIRASYGPFSTKQTVPARYIVPEVSGSHTEYQTNTTAALYELQNSNIHLDISAHLVRSNIPQDSPVLRVLFHAGADPTGHFQRQKVCVSLHVTMGTAEPVKGRCMPEGEDGVCVAEVLIPSTWWPSIPISQKWKTSDGRLKVPTRHAQVSYSVFEPPLRNPEHCEPKVQVLPLTTFAEVVLAPASTSYKEMSADEVVTVMLPNSPLYPLSKLYVPVFLKMPNDSKISTVIMRARIKAGFKILGAKRSSDLWNISFEKESAKYMICKVTAFKVDEKQSILNNTSLFTTEDGAIQIFSWLFEVTNDVDGALDDGKIVWSINYIYTQSSITDLSNNQTVNYVKKKIIAKFEINKDDIQAVLPMAKNWELMNTAVLTGRQVAQAMKVFIVSQAGKVADVTLQSSCNAEDESVIKVSSSCSSVYVDGSEIRGSSNASIIVKYGNNIGKAKFVVWMPEFPLEVYMSDFRLSQIKGWKILDETQNLYGKMYQRRKKRSYMIYKNESTFSQVSTEKFGCKARYQQSTVEVYSRFLAIDQNSGRISYFISRRTSLRVTDIVQPLLRVTDPKIATLKGRILQGKSMGRTEVQVLSPITGRVIGAKEIRVGSDKISLTKLSVRVISGLQLSIFPDNSITNGYLAETSVTQKLTAQYQEGLLDIDLEFSDGTKTPLRDVAVDDYFLLVESLDTEIVAFAPMLASHHPRVIAVGEGHGNLLKISMLMSDDCRLRRSLTHLKHSKSSFLPLASALAFVEVDFNNIDLVSQNDAVQNDGIVNKDKKGLKSIDDLSDIIDSSYGHDTYIQSRRYRGNVHLKNELFLKKKGLMTSMEFGIFVLLTAFCFAIVIFVISCVVYASKFRKISIDNIPLRTENPNTRGLLPNDVTTNAHDWVWLGRSPMEKSTALTGIGRQKDITKDFQVRITSNPINNFTDHGDLQSNYGSSNKERLPNIAKLETGYKPPVPPHRNVCIRVVDEENLAVNNMSAVQNIDNDERVRYTPQMSLEKNEAPKEFLVKSSDKHNAEILVDFPHDCNMNAFQFDSTLPPEISKPQVIEERFIHFKSSKNPNRKRLKRASVVGNPMFISKTDSALISEENMSFDRLDMDYEQIMHYFDNLKESNA